MNIIEKTIDKHAPLERMSRKQQKLAEKPWITKGILTSKRKRNSMFRIHYITGNQRWSRKHKARGQGQGHKKIRGQG